MFYLTLLLAIPLIGALAIALVPDHRKLLIRRMAVVCSMLTLLLALGLTTLFDPHSHTLQLVEHFHWNTRLGTYYAMTGVTRDEQHGSYRTF